VSENRWNRRRQLIAALALAVGTIAANQVSGSNPGLDQLPWLILAVASFVLVAPNALARAPSNEDTTSTIRMRAVERSLDELRKADVLNRDIDRHIPVTVLDANGARHTTVDALVQGLLEAAPTARCVITGGPGAGKSIMLHRLAVAINAREDPVVAVVLPLAAYDWTSERLVDWLSREVAGWAGRTEADVGRLIAEERLFLLLDGLDSVPNRSVLLGQALPESEWPLFDRMVSGADRLERHSSASAADPRAQLISRLAGLRGFVVTTRSHLLSEAEQRGLDHYKRAALEELPSAAAVELLRKRAPTMPNEALTLGFRETIRSPLYLRLAAEVCGEHLVFPEGSQTVAEMRAWLWDHHLDYRLAGAERQDLGWNPQVVRHWLEECAEATGGQHGLALRRWPLLYGGRARFGLRLARSTASSALVGVLALYFLAPWAAVVVGIVALPLFLAAGEGAATLPLAPQRFTIGRFVGEALHQWPYWGGFGVAGGIFGWVITKHWAWIKVVHAAPGTTISTGIAAGLLLGLTVPTLYELSYIDEGALYGGRYRGHTVMATVLSAIIIGGISGLIVAFALNVAFHSATAFLLATPICVMLALLDTLGLPVAAILLWAAERRGPVRIERFLSIAAHLGVARAFGQFYFLEHSELQDFLASGRVADDETSA
jgi:hypothetical protein